MQEAVNGRHPHSGKMGLPLQCGHFPDKRGSSDSNVRTFWFKNLRIFRKLWCVRTDKEGCQCGRFRKNQCFVVKVKSVYNI